MILFVFRRCLICIQCLPNKFKRIVRAYLAAMPRSVRRTWCCTVSRSWTTWKRLILIKWTHIRETQIPYVSVAYYHSKAINPCQIQIRINEPSRPTTWWFQIDNMDIYINYWWTVKRGGLRDFSSRQSLVIDLFAFITIIEGAFLHRT